MVDGVGVLDMGGVFTSVVLRPADIAVVTGTVIIVGVDSGMDEFEGGTMGNIQKFCIRIIMFAVIM